MILIEVNIQDIGVSEGISAVIRTCQDKTALHEAMAAGVEQRVSEHLLAKNSLSPNSGFYASASKSTEVQADSAGAMVMITKRGMALRYYGGRVLPGKTISSFTGKRTTTLAIPSENVPMAGKEGRKGPREMGILAFIPSKKSGTVGVLVEGEMKNRVRKPGQRVVPKDGGKLMYVLRSWTDHKEDKSLLPTIASLLTAATDAAHDYFAATNPNSPS